MKIAVVGAGYVGLVTATCLAELGNDVVCVDRDHGRIAVLQAGGLPIFEPGLDDLVQRNRSGERLRFTTSMALAAAVQSNCVIATAASNLSPRLREAAAFEGIRIVSSPTTASKGA